MRTVYLLATSLALICFAGPLQGDEPVLDKGVYVYNGAIPLEVDRHSTPEVVDWNNDGKKDLIIGQFGYGNIWLFLNQGTDLNPLFNGGAKLKSGASVITTSYG